MWYELLIAMNSRTCTHKQSFHAYEWRTAHIHTMQFTSFSGRIEWIGWFIFGRLLLNSYTHLSFVVPIVFFCVFNANTRSLCNLDVLLYMLLTHYTIHLMIWLSFYFSLCSLCWLVWTIRHHEAVFLQADERKRNKQKIVITTKVNKSDNKKVANAIILMYV